MYGLLYIIPGSTEDGNQSPPENERRGERGGEGRLGEQNCMFFITQIKVVRSTHKHMTARRSESLRGFLRLANTDIESTLKM